MLMSHMLADSDEELHAMAAALGLSRSWWQSPERTSGSHYDVCKSVKDRALAMGAVAITVREAAAMNFRRKRTGDLGRPEDAEQWMRAAIRERAGRKSGGPVEN